MGTMDDQPDPIRSALAGLLTSPHQAALTFAAATLPEFCDAAIAEGVLSLVAEQMDVAAVPKDARAFWSALRRQAAAEELGRQAAEQRVITCLHAAGLVPLVLKGAALARWLYPQPHLRPRGDLDLLFADHAEVLQAERALLALGFCWDGQLSNGPGFERVLIGSVMGRILHVDAHWQLTSHPAFARTWSYAALRDEAVPLPTLDAALALSPMHASFHNALHRVGDLLHGTADRMIGLYDLHLLATRMTEEDWSRLRTLSQAHCIAGPVLHALAAAQNALGTVVPGDVLKELAHVAQSESFRMAWADRRWYFEWHLLKSLPWRDWPSHAVRKLCPAPGYMMQRYSLSLRSQLPSAYLRRVIDALERLFKRGSPN